MPDPSERRGTPIEGGAVPFCAAGCPTAATLTRTFDSADLFGDAKTVLIDHDGEQYRLIKTKNGKLLLQK